MTTYSHDSKKFCRALRRELVNDGYPSEVTKPLNQPYNRDRGYTTDIHKGCRAEHSPRNFLSGTFYWEQCSPRSFLPGTFPWELSPRSCGLLGTFSRELSLGNNALLGAFSQELSSRRFLLGAAVSWELSPGHDILLELYSQAIILCKF
jgi:hypothetical protein